MAEVINALDPNIGSGDAFVEAKLQAMQVRVVFVVGGGGGVLV